MKTINEFKTPIKILFTDIDDTLTQDGQLPSQSYEMLWQLAEAGIKIIPVTGRPAGWCEMIARMWPVFAVIGENGALSFQYKDKKMLRTFALDENTRLQNNQKLQELQTQILTKVPGCDVASDQFTRMFDLAIDFCEDVAPLEQNQIQKIVDCFTAAGATAKVSSIHVNGWFGTYNKLSMCKSFYQQQFGRSLQEDNSLCAFAGDSPNDEPMFEFFENSVAVANILNFKDQLKHLPTYVTPSEAAQGFVEFGNIILKNGN